MSEPLLLILRHWRSPTLKNSININSNTIKHFFKKRISVITITMPSIEEELGLTEVDDLCLAFGTSGWHLLMFCPVVS